MHATAYSAYFLQNSLYFLIASKGYSGESLKILNNFTKRKKSESVKSWNLGPLYSNVDSLKEPIPKNIALF
jgi:hypothetical protein